MPAPGFFELLQLVSISRLNRSILRHLILLQAIELSLSQQGLGPLDFLFGPAGLPVLLVLDLPHLAVLEHVPTSSKAYSDCLKDCALVLKGFAFLPLSIIGTLSCVLKKRAGLSIFFLLVVGCLVLSSDVMVLYLESWMDSSEMALDIFY